MIEYSSGESDFLGFVGVVLVYLCWVDGCFCYDSIGSNWLFVVSNVGLFVFFFYLLDMKL